MDGLLNMEEMTQESSFINACFQFVPASVVLLPPVEGQKGRRHKLANSGVWFLRLSPRWLHALPRFPLDFMSWDQISNLLLDAIFTD